MKKIAFFCTACGLMLISSCTTVKKTATAVDVSNGVYQYPVVANLEVKEKVEATKEWSFRPFHIGEMKVSVAKGNLISETLKNCNADVLLEPQFHFTKVPFGMRKLVVTGYPASYKNFRDATEKDMEVIKAANNPNVRTNYNEIGFDIFKILK